MQFILWCYSQLIFVDDNLRPAEKTSPNGVGDIMGRLEQAIASGNHKEAALLAKEVSKLQISTKLVKKESSQSQKPHLLKQEKIKYVILKMINLSPLSYLIIYI